MSQKSSLPQSTQSASDNRRTAVTNDRTAGTPEFTAGTPEFDSPVDFGPSSVQPLGELRKNAP